MSAWSWALRKRLIHWLAGGRHYIVNQPPLHATPFQTTGSNGNVTLISRERESA